MFRRLVRAGRDLVGFTSSFVTDASFRAAVQAARTDAGLSPAQRRELDRAAPEARPHHRIDTRALALASIRIDDSRAPAIVLVLSDLRPDAMFAGVATALDLAAGLADRTGRPLRVVVLSEDLADADRAALLSSLSGTATEVTLRDDLADATFGDRDIWVVTHWTTAYAAHVAAIAGRLDRSRVVSLVQDFEPGFTGWGVASTAAEATYRAGFTLVVNSRPLAEHLRRTGVEVDDDLTAAPALITGIEPRRSDAPQRVLFYGRPSKPRNLFPVGIAALESAVAQLGDAARAVEFVSAGEAHDDIALGDGVVLRSLGVVDLDTYRDLLATSTVVLSLQASPHPSHPPLEAALAGAIAVTNRFGTTRDDLHPNLHAVAADPDALATAVATALTADVATASVTPLRDGVLGRPLTAVLDELARRVG